ncbi:hypothetical protein CASFOL_028053 [Castilleja foliolosa]
MGPKKAQPQRKNTRSNTRGSSSQGPSEPINISGNNGVPFPVYTKEEVAQYKSIKNRRITNPKQFDMQYYEDLEVAGNELAKDVMRYIRHMGCEELGSTMGPAHTELMHEFYTTFRVTPHHEMCYRLGGQEFVLSKREVEEVFGFDGKGEPMGNFVARESEAFWTSLTNGNPGAFDKMQATSIHDDAIFVCYKFLVHVVLNKDDASVLSKNELKALYLMMKGETVPILPMMIASISAIAKDRGTKWPARLTFGGHISMLAQYHNIPVDDAQADTPVEKYVIKKRKYMGKWKDIPVLDGDNDDYMEEPEWQGEDGYGANEYMTRDEDVMERLNGMHLEANRWYNEYQEDKQEWAAWRADYERNQREDELKFENSERVAQARHEETNAKLDAILAAQARWGHHGGSSSGGPGL